MSPLKRSLNVTVLVWWVSSYKSLIKSRHVEARRVLGLQCKLWPEPNALLSCPGQDGGGIFLLPGVARGGVSKLLQSLSVLGFPLATVKNKRADTHVLVSTVCLYFTKQGPVRCSTWKLKNKFDCQQIP